MAWFGVRLGPFVAGAQTPPSQTPTAGQFLAVLVIVGATFVLWRTVWPLGLLVTLVEVFVLGAVVRDALSRGRKP